MVVCRVAKRKLMEHSVLFTWTEITPISAKILYGTAQFKLQENSRVIFCTHTTRLLLDSSQAVESTTNWWCLTYHLLRADHSWILFRYEYITREFSQYEFCKTQNTTVESSLYECKFIIMCEHKYRWRSSRLANYAQALLNCNPTYSVYV